MSEVSMRTIAATTVIVDDVDDECEGGDGDADSADPNPELCDNECTIEVPTLTTTTTIISAKRTKRLGKVEFVRFDSKETVFADHDDITAQIKDEIQR